MSLSRFRLPTMPSSRIALSAALCGATLLLAGCAGFGPWVGRDYQAPATTVPARWSAVSGDHGTPEALAVWWRQLGDPFLDELIDRALAGNLDLRGAAARLRQARASRDLAQAGLFPSLDASVRRSRTEAARSGGGGTTNLYSGGIDASWEPDIFGGARRGVEAATADVAATAASAEGTRVSLVAEVALNYVSLRSAQARIAIARSNLSSQEETLAITAWRAQAGLATELDVAQASTNLEQTRAAIPPLESALAQAENRLAILLGLTPGKLHDRLAASRPLPVAPDGVAVGIPADTLRQRPDVRAAERTLAAETARLGQQQAALWPSLSLSGSLGWQAFSAAALGGSGSFTRSLAGSLAANLFDGGRIRRRIAAQDAVQEQALVTYEQTVLTALEDVENGLVAYASARDKRDTRQRAATSARQAATLSRQLYQAGLADFQKVLDTERTQLTAEDSLATAEADVLTAVIQLYKALGGGWNAASAGASPVQPTESKSS